MFDVFGSVKGLLKLKLDSVNIDNFIFRLHYKATVIILISFSLLVTSRQYIGDPIDCIVEDIPSNVMDMYCWISSTFTIPSKMKGTDIAYPGVQAQHEGEQVKYHQYYQWVCFVLFFQALLFYFPCHLWKAWESGKMKMLVLELNCPIMDEETKKERIKLLVNYFASHWNNHNCYAFRFFVCEILNFINVIGQIYFVDFFLGGEFMTYGRDVFSMTEMEPEDRVDPMSKVFPKVTKCTFNKFGPSGTIERIDGLCILPLNVVNEKIYVFLWFWFILLAVLSSLALIYRLAVLMGSRTRMFLLRAQAQLADRSEVESVARKCQIGDWFILVLLSKNIDSLAYKELISDLACRFDGREEIQPA